LLIVIISHHYTEAHSVEALQERHRSEEADARLGRGPRRRRRRRPGGWARRARTSGRTAHPGRRL